MSTLLGHLQEQLGAIDIWPTLILRMLFADDPSPRSITTLASLFFGNRVAFEVAAPFCTLCIGNNHLQIVDIFTILFLKWTRDLHTRRQTLYYDMTLRRFMFVNGLACHEPREPLPIHLSGIPLPLGFAGLGGRTKAIKGKLRLAGDTPTPTC
jgi:hypothetical protein